MKKYTYLELKNRCIKFGFNWYPFQLIGIRSQADVPNQFDDKMYLISGTNLFEYTCTTHPGTSWLTKLINPKGAAVLVPDKQYINAWALGKHRNKYDALVQVKPVTVYRDGNKNLKSDETGLIDTGLFGINIHRAHEFVVSKLIDTWSAGCQVLNDPKQFTELMAFAKLSGQKFFTYTLLKEF